MRHIAIAPEHWQATQWTCAFGSPKPTRHSRRHCFSQTNFVANFSARGRRTVRISSPVRGQVFPTGGLLLTIVIVMAGGCASREPFVSREPLGPAQAVAPAAGAPGNLVVYSAWDRFDTLDAEHPKHTAYTIRSEKDAVVAQVRNQTGSFGQDPSMVSLPSGRYWVQARATNVGAVRIPVIIRSGQTTMVYLDGSTAPTEPQVAEKSGLR